MSECLNVHEVNASPLFSGYFSYFSFLYDFSRFSFQLCTMMADVPPVGNRRSCFIAVTLHFEMVVSAGKVADLQ